MSELPSSEIAVELNHLYKTYQNDKHALKNISLKIEQGEFVYVIGHSGAGKSTLFKILSAQELASSGEIKSLGFSVNLLTYKNVHLYRQQIGVIFQDFKLINELNNYDNIVLSLRLKRAHQKLSRSAEEKFVHEICDLVQISKSDLDEFPEALSGGEQQKIAIARAIIHKPKLILADEPTGNLDRMASQNILAILKELTNWKTTVFFATHDEQLWHNTQDRKLTLKKGELQ